MLLPARDLAGAQHVAERVRREIMALRIPVDGKVVTLTASLGVAEWRRGESVDAMMRRADMALYAAKGAGRNRVVAADDDLPPRDYDGADRPVRSVTREGDAAIIALPANPRSAA